MEGQARLDTESVRTIGRQGCMVDRTAASLPLQLAFHVFDSQNDKWSRTQL